MDTGSASAEIQAIMTRLCADERAALADLYALTSSQVYGAICRLLADQESRNQVMIETYRDAWNHRRERAETSANHMDWLYSIAHRHALRAYYDLSNNDLADSGKPLATRPPIDATLPSGIGSHLNEEEAKLILSTYLDGRSSGAPAQHHATSKAELVEKMVGIVNKMRGRL